MTSRDIKKGDLVWWTMGSHRPLRFEDKELFIGIVTQVAKTRAGVEVYWFNNSLFKVMNRDALMIADISQWEEENKAEKI